MDPLPKIPSPPRLLWREIRHRFFPVVVFGIALAGAVILWRDQAAAPHLIGEVESIVSAVSTVEDGMIIELNVDRFQSVAQGEPVAEFRISDPESVRLELATIATDLQVLQTRMAQDQQRILQDYEQLRLNWLSERVALATARVELQFAESELNRIGKLAADRLISEDQHELAKSVAESRRAEVAERNQLVGEIEAGLKRLAPEDAGRFGTEIAAKFDDAISAQEELLRQSSKTVTLRAPISGLVTVIHHRQGERVRRGEPIVSITATTPERIVGYLRPPLNASPQPGDTVEVRSRAGNRQVGLARVLQVGNHFEVISTNLVSASLPATTRALPLLISLPDNLTLLPGEVVDLALRPE